ncbi:MAG: hypothetical protein KDK10_14160 [Maritimibacter sp.]|nr:hypothetical protein [Maritimibacter sp.]
MSLARLSKLVQFPIWVALACLVAGLYGAAHNQVSYTLGPSYFTAFKFAQFQIGADVPPRLGAALVGWRASWWMGALTGVPLFALALAARSRAAYARLCRMALATVLGTALLLGAVAVLLGVTVLGEEHLALLLGGRNPPDPMGFARAGLLHDTSYLGGLAGFALAALRIAVRLWRSYRGSGAA